MSSEDLNVFMGIDSTGVIPQTFYKKYDSKTLGELIVYRWNKKHDVPSLKNVPLDFQQDTEIMMQIHSEDFDAIAKEGFKNMHQTQHSSTTFGFTLPDRAVTENMLMDIAAEETYLPQPNNPIHVLRPKYGYLNFSTPMDLGQSSLHIDFYGDITVVFKNEIKKRATWTLDDSFATSRVRVNQVGGIFNFEGTFFNTVFPLQNWGSGYTEAQVYGELTLDDVSHFIVSSDFPENKLEGLKKTGLPVYLGKLQNEYNIDLKVMNLG